MMSGKGYRVFISIHALREESDLLCNSFANNINRFQSTLSVRRATFRRCSFGTKSNISIHALREESDGNG